LDWEWNYLLPNLEYQDRIIVEEDDIPFLRMVDNQGKILAERGDWRMVYVAPHYMYDWNRHLELLSKLTGKTTMEVDGMIRQVVPDLFPRFVGFLDLRLEINEGKSLAKSLPGIELKNVRYPVVRKDISDVENIARKIRQLEQERPSIFFIRARAYLVKEKKKIILPFEGVEKNDVLVKI
jgi:hypothetical protein